MDPDKKHVLDVGNCDPDHSMISSMLNEHFDVTIDRVMHVSDAVKKMRANRYDLVLFNRLIFAGGSEGIELLRQCKADSALSDVPVMMISNFEEAQQTSIAAGGVPGFGKASVHDSETIQRLSKYLGRRDSRTAGG